MFRNKYYYDKETLSYLPVKTGKVRKISNFFLFLISSLVFGILILFGLLYNNVVNTPKEVLQERELKNYEFQIDILNKKLDEIESVLTNIEDRDNNLYRIYFEASPIPEEQRRAGFGGINRYKELEGYENSQLIINLTKRLDILTKQIVIQSRSLEEIESLSKSKKELLEAIPSIQPIRNEDVKRMASGYGYRTDPFTKKRRLHKGMDFSASRGTPIYSSGSGIVKRADNRAPGYGKHIRIDHGFGYVGNTGRSVAPHLHYEIFKDGKRINPLNFYYGNLSASEFNQLVNQANQENQSLD